MEVENSDTYFKLSSGWVTEEVLGYVSYRSADGSVTLNPSHFQDQNYWDYVQFVEETEGQACDESAYLILGDDMDWYVIRWGDYFIAFCPAYRGDGTVAFNFETDGSESACATMRRILSSVCY